MMLVRSKTLFCFQRFASKHGMYHNNLLDKSTTRKKGNHGLAVKGQNSKRPKY